MLEAQRLTFRHFAVSEATLKTLDDLGFHHPTPIQERAIPPGLLGRDVLGKARTGTGKTLAFGLPLLERIDASRVSAQALVLLPTRELAQQVAEHLEAVAEGREIRVALLVGGEKVRFQRARIPGRQVIVGTPGRVLDLLKERILHLEWAECFVLDEFDRMLDMGFIDDVQRIAAYLPPERQTMLFSATVPPEIGRLASKFLKDPVVVEVESGLQTAEGATQQALHVKDSDRLDVLIKLIEKDLESEDATLLVFCNTRFAVAELDREFFGRNFPAASLSGELEQSRRFEVMDGFREKRIRVLVATDVASRGLDVDHVGHVINFDVPKEVEDYVHRIGRTARAGRKGLVTTLVVPRQEREMQRILDRLGDRIRVGRVILHGAPRSRYEPTGIGRRSANPYAMARANEAQARHGGRSYERGSNHGGRGGDSRPPNRSRSAPQDRAKGRDYRR
jgi:ATP-dependent RNA helicase DeaD